MQLLIFRQDAPLISPHPAHLAAEPYRASGLVRWHKCEVPAASSNVRVRGQSGIRIFALVLRERPSWFNAHARERDLPVGQKNLRARKPVQPCSRKYSASRLPQITRTVSAVPAREGAYRDRHGRRAGDAMDAVVSGAIIARTNDAAAYGEVVWFWRSDAGASLRS